MCVSKLTIIGSDNGLSPGWRQAIIWTNDEILLIRTLQTDFSDILSEIHAFSCKKMTLKMSSVKWLQYCFGLNVLNKQFLRQVGRSAAYWSLCYWYIHNLIVLQWYCSMLLRNCIHFAAMCYFTLHKTMLIIIYFIASLEYHFPISIPWLSNENTNSTFKSSPPSAAYMYLWMGSALVQIMACRLFGAKPLFKPMLVYCQLNPKEQTSVKF